MQKAIAFDSRLCYTIVDEFYNYLIKSGGETGSVKPRQPAVSKVLIPEDESKESPGLAGDFYL